jgi:hypothetical protein
MQENLLIKVNKNSDTVKNYSACWNGGGDNPGPNC